MKGYSLRVAHLYPDQMNLYGARGNLLAFIYRAGLRGISVEVEQLEPGDPIERGRYDFFFLGGGQETEIYEDFISVKGRALADELDKGAACLAVGGAYQLLGKSYETSAGKKLPGLGWLDAWTEAGSRRAVGNILIESSLEGERVELVGFESHQGRTFLGGGVAPLGKVVIGFGNNGQDQTEGALLNSVVGTYLHGPVLPKNPALTDWLLARSLARRCTDYLLEPVESPLEEAAFAEAKAVTIGQ